jgi:hypothetical protein
MKDDKSLTEQLRERIEKLEITDESSKSDQHEQSDTSQHSVQWRFVSECLKYLQSIQQALNAKADTEGRHARCQ